MKVLSKFEPPHDLHFGISKMLKDCLVSFLSLESVQTNYNGTSSKLWPPWHATNAVLHVYASLFSAKEEDSGNAEVKMDFSPVDTSPEHKGFSQLKAWQ